MNFYEYPDTFSLFQKIMPGMTRDGMYAALSQLAVDHPDTRDPIGFAHLEWERNWHAARRPFYRVWPKIIPMLTRLDTSLVPSKACRLTGDLIDLYVQFPHGNMLCGDRDLQGAFIGRLQTSAGPGTVIGAIDGKTSTEFGYPIPLIDMWLFEHSDDPLVEVLDRLKLAAELKTTLGTREVVTSLLTTLCLIQDDPDLISPVLLSKDAKRPDLTPEDLERLAAKARKRGRYGFDIGKGVEVMPHYRRPHTALMWTGQGRKIPKVVLRKGAVVHRSKIDSIPTGYLDDAE